jgi:hypothetical protein
MDHKDREARIILWENNAKFIQVAYVQEDGQEVIGRYERWGWVQPPSEVVDDVLNTLRKGPRRVVGRQK